MMLSGVSAARATSLSSRARTDRRALNNNRSPAVHARCNRRATVRAHHGPLVNLQFTPDSALAGGLILGSMVVAKRLNGGKNLGVSGETKAITRGAGTANSAAFLLGIAGAGYLAPMILGAQAPVPMVDATRAIIAGALVGVGSSVGCGCTSGHGISGIGRFNMRSVAFTAVFMVVGAITVALTGTMAELHVSTATKTIDMVARAPPVKAALYAKLFAAGVAIQGALYTLAKREGGGITDVVKRLELVSEHVAGLFFGLGLVVSGMTNPAKVAGFLAVTSQAFDPSLAFVMGGALTLVTVSMYAAKNVFGINRPSMAREFTSTPKYVDKELLIGGALFGAGWGLAGICPGPGFVNLLLNSGREITLWCASFLLAQKVHQQLVQDCKLES
jgi:uncharacterized membrane protein YedE/YeeE